MRDDRVARDLGHAAPELAAQRRRREKEHQRRDDAGVDQQRIGRVETSGPLPFPQDAAERLQHVADVLERRLIDVRAPLGDLAQPDRRKVGAGFPFGGDGIDEPADFFFGSQRRGGDGAYAGADRVEHVAEDRAVERGLALVVVIDHRLVDAGRARDSIDVGAGVAARGELGRGGGEDPGAGIGGSREGGGGAGHRGVLTN